MDNTFTFFIRSNAQLDDPYVLQDLVAQKEDILAPLLETYAHDKIWYNVEKLVYHWNSTRLYHTAMVSQYLAFLQEDTNSNMQRYDDI